MMGTSRRDFIKRSSIRRKRAKPRRGPLRSPDYRAWLIAECVCVACRILHMVYRTRQFASGGQCIDPAHTQNNGMRSKGPDSSCAPLCRVHHREYDAGPKAFEMKYGVDMKNEAAAHWAAWQLVKEAA